MSPSQGPRGGATAAMSDAVVAVPDGEDVRLLDPVTGRLRTSLSSIQGGDPVTGVWVSGAIVVVQVGYPFDYLLNRTLPGPWCRGFGRGRYGR